MISLSYTIFWDISRSNIRSEPTLLVVFVLCVCVVVIVTGMVTDTGIVSSHSYLCLLEYVLGAYAKH
jgi:hypothetical protein